jgi:hypothetical protein
MALPNEAYPQMLTDSAIRAAKPSEKSQKLFDEKGLFLLISPAGGRLWRFKYRFPSSGPGKTEKLLALGAYPEVSLEEAREDRDEARKDLVRKAEIAFIRRVCYVALIYQPDFAPPQRVAYPF